MKIQVPPPGKPPGLAEVLAKMERNLKEVIEEKDNENQPQSWDPSQP